jgi:cardiolipin synthase
MAQNGVEPTDGLRAAVWTVPNLLSLFRILLVPVFVWSIFNRKAFEALLIFFIAGLTDFLDGLAARAWSQRSRLGTVLDPAGDKLLMAASYIVLTMKGVASPNAIPVWLMVTVFSRDLVIVFGALFAFLRWKQKAFFPSLLGKICTGFQVGTIFWTLYFNYRGTAPGVLPVLFGLTLVATVASGVDYFFYGLRILRQNRKG